MTQLWPELAGIDDAIEIDGEIEMSNLVTLHIAIHKEMIRALKSPPPPGLPPPPPPPPDPYLLFSNEVSQRRQ